MALSLPEPIVKSDGARVCFTWRCGPCGWRNAMGVPLHLAGKSLAFNNRAIVVFSHLAATLPKVAHSEFRYRSSRSSTWLSL